MMASNGGGAQKAAHTHCCHSQQQLVSFLKARLLSWNFLQRSENVCAGMSIEALLVTAWTGSHPDVLQQVKVLELLTPACLFYLASGL